VEAHVLLADFAQSDSAGKVNALGLGWSVTVTPTPHHAVVVILRVAWDEANIKHHLTLRLLTADGLNAVEVPTPFGSQPLVVEAEFEIGRPPGLAHGSSIDHSLAINVGSGLPLAAGRYEWRLQVDDEQREDWHAAFTVRQPQAAPAPGFGASDSPANP
jgi:hypothetical protein